MSSLKATKLPCFTVQNRQEIINSIVNQSKSKYSWTFSKQKRFPQHKDLFQLNHTNKYTFINNKTMKQQASFAPKNYSYGFGKSQRKLFTQVLQTPSCWNYNPQSPKNKWKNNLLPQGRDKCISGSYINKQQLKIPDPAAYKVKSLQSPIKYTMRPKTEHQRTYFIQNKQAKQVPGPGKYNQDFEAVARKSFTSKFRNSSLGISGIRSKSLRFYTDPDKKSFMTTSLYQNLKASWSKGCSIGSQKRESFIQKISKIHDAPGPGKYQLPNEFGHYKKITSNEYKKQVQIK